MNYILLKKIIQPGYCRVYSIAAESDDITKIKDELVKRTRDGGTVRDFRIVSEIDFELKMAVQLREETSHE